MEYRAPGKANKFTLHCSLQRVTGRMFVNATEDTNLANNQVRAWSAVGGRAAPRLGSGAARTPL